MKGHHLLTFHYRESAQLDRLALDEQSEDEESKASRASSRADLFTAQSTTSIAHSVREQEKEEEAEETPITEVNI